MSELFVTGQRVLPEKARELGFVFAAPSLEDALEPLLGRARDEIGDPFTVYYNDRCPVCSREIAHYRRKAETRPDANGLRFVALSRDPQALAPHGLDAEAAKKRLYALDAGGQLYGGVEVFQVLWARVPGLEWLARLVAWHPVRPVAALLYDRLAVPLLWHWNRRRQHKEDRHAQA